MELQIKDYCSKYSTSQIKVQKYTQKPNKISFSFFLIKIYYKMPENKLLGAKTVRFFCFSAILLK
jgi:hypothetical protein